ncbi:hypothetical protein [Bacillus cereus]|uniref:Uncharacterized protein n=1 Tax=Bacillus cereus HuA3-9 TaxID=1053205 RepID=R8CIH3_BACCE|nr:hypothetical protein [Bacillus cereus]EOO11335.1 hypothetical protein IGA_05598 [Bacillus cereus HuA3-9]
MTETIKWIPIEITYKGEQEVEEFKKTIELFNAKKKERASLVEKFKGIQMFMVKKMFDYNGLRDAKSNMALDVYINDYTKNCDVKDIWIMQESMKDLMNTKIDMKRLETEIDALQDKIIKHGWMRYL